MSRWRGEALFLLATRDALRFHSLWWLAGLHGLQEGVTWREGRRGRGESHEHATAREHEECTGRQEGGGAEVARWVRCPLAAEHGKTLGILPTQTLTTLRLKHA